MCYVLGMSTREPPRLLGYETRVDDAGFHARYFKPLPEAAQVAGCVQELVAPTVRELTDAAVHNRVRIWVWQTGQRAAPVMALLLCLYCGLPVEENLDGAWENPDGQPCRPGRSHSVRQVIPDPPQDPSLSRAPVACLGLPDEP